MSSGRLVKVILPSHVVAAMDAFINRSPDYAGRAEVIGDSIEGFLAEMAAAMPDPLPDVPAQPVSAVTRAAEPMPGVLAAAAIELHRAPVGVPLLDPVKGLPRAEFTWGLHNRDFPTVWATQHLAVTTANEGSPVPYSEWLEALARDAWRVARALSDDRRFDLSGFPTNAAKWSKAEARFISFFVGAVDGTGPLFDLGLAGVDDAGRCALTVAGSDVLDALDGWDCAIDTSMSDTRRRAWLHHLAIWAPADLALFQRVVTAIIAGADSRDALLSVIAESYNAWSASQVSTNAAAAVSRLREVGLVERRQNAGRYVLAGGREWTVAELDQATGPDGSANSKETSR